MLIYPEQALEQKAELSRAGFGTEGLSCPRQALEQKAELSKTGFGTEG